MAELLPTRQSRDLVEGLRDYLTTTFALSDSRAQRAIGDFLMDAGKGMFKGPFVRLRLPFEPAADGWREALDFYGVGFPPYGHQAKAFQRLTTKTPDSTGFRRPQPTLVTTGTGSGKTESFLFPIVDHVLRAQKAGITGIKALILYPMNALANDQADRLAGLLTGHSELGGIRAALYTGQQGVSRKHVTRDGLITDRQEIRNNPPDILLTNYKMLDMLLLRHEDASLWRDSATSLQYLVLDEFHTYDGAQGTDVAMLLRRLGLALKSSWPEDLTPQGLTEEDRRRPLGRITPVATSATLGGSGGARAMLDFAETIFGEPLEDEALVTESRMSFDTWKGLSIRDPGVVARDLDDIDEHIVPTNEAVRADDSHASLLEATLKALFEKPPAGEADDLLTALRHHPLTERLVAEAGIAVGLRDLAATLLPRIDISEAEEFLSHVIALYSHVRAGAGRGALTVEAHLWVRELSRIESALDVTNAYRWGDDGVEEDEEGGEGEEGRELIHLPAVFCRHCGKSGWGAKVSPTGAELGLEPAEIRAASLNRDASFRALIHAANEADALVSGAVDAREARDQGLRFFHTVQKSLAVDPPVEDDPEFRLGRIIPVLTHAGLEAGELSRKDTCPACLAPDAIRFVGSAIATLTSVAVSNLFGARGLDSGEKKALIFTDSVQDAAHRAGFIQARSHTFNLRTSLRNAFGTGAGETATLSQLIDQAMAVPPGPDAAVQRFKLVPPELTEREGFREFWDETAAPGPRARARENVKRRLRFDAALELGLQARLGRTLELTGAVVAETDAGSPAAVAVMGRRVWDTKLHVLPDVGEPTDEQFRAWVRGVLIRMRLQGGIHHEWLDRYIEHDGARYHVWGGRARHQGMPAFPKGRPAPAFPVIGPSKPENGLDPVTPKTSWYSSWTSRALGVSPDDAGYLARELFEDLARTGILKEHATDQGARAYSINPDRILLTTPEDDALRGKRHAVECEVCRTRSFGTETVIDQLDGAPCLQLKCGGRAARVEVQPENFYRRMYAELDGKRVVAREHTSLLDDGLRLEYEDAFKAVEQTPDAPNVLVATPTLEMGIDIGDLSCVMLASMPGSVASYVQRVGRAGRLTGNSLVLAFIRGRGEHLPKLYDPLSVINGDVRPPSTYLQAEEILQRQFAAFLGDRLASDPRAPHPRSAREALKSTAPDSYLGSMLGLMDEQGDALLAHFLGQFSPDQVTEEGRQRLADWAASTLPLELGQVSRQWQLDHDDLQRRISDVEDAVAELKEEHQRRLHEYAHDSEHPKVQEAARDLRSGESQLKRLYREAQEERSEYWISKIEMYGLFPNYTLIGDPVTLDVGISWRNEETQGFEARTETFARSAGIAIHELAPGSTFYAQGMEIEVDAVDLGPELREVQYWQLCPACGWKQSVDRIGEQPVQYSGVSATCPRCTTAGIDDVGHVHAVVVLKKVTAEIKRDEAVIGDARDDRRRTGFQMLAVADVNPARVESRWFVENNGFGAEYLGSVDVTWLNLGARGRGGASLTIAGHTLSVPRFALCEYCGKQDTNFRANSEDEHRFWCRHRKSQEEHALHLLLARELRTQGVKLHMPAAASSVDAFALPTLKAALLLGLQEHLGGTPGHLGILTIPDGAGSVDRQALLIHDSVPGGTGYLASFKSPQDVFAVLAAALAKVAACRCAGERRRACHLCLLPFAEYGSEDYVSRVEAKRLLEHLLGIEADEGPDLEKWVLREEPVVVASGESVLEIAFRQALKTRLAAVNAEVTPKPGPRGEKLVIKLPSQNHRWTLDPQVDAYGTRPDFMLTYEGPNVPQVAVYTDGRAFHASSEAGCNRVGDDAVKRCGLKMAGIVPWAITDQDVQRFGDGPAVEARYDEWVSGIMLSQLTKAHSLDPNVLASMRGGAMEMLWTWMTNPQPESWSKVADVVAGLAAQGLNRTEVAGATVPDFQFDLARTSPGLLNGSIWWSRSTEHLHLIAAGHPLKAQGGVVPAALSLDDRAEAVGSANFAEQWRRWLFWSNLLAFQTSPKTALVGTESSRDEILEVAGFAGHADGPVDYVGASGTTGLSGAWAPVLEVADDDEEREFIVRLAGTSLPPPQEWGEEIDGIPAQLVWTSAKIAIVYDDESGHELAHAGWTAIVTGDIDKVLDAHGVVPKGKE
ncbi:DEAD/DEAH box helicase [Zafaria sp. Z1313]|uniref:DEAD/DEAH box helicase n=1 Tax=Zafaria sp. Z1313 TaxID=3423202 RepID=UPI003D303973